MYWGGGRGGAAECLTRSNVGLVGLIAPSLSFCYPSQTCWCVAGGVRAVGMLTRQTQGLDIYSR